MDLTTVNRKSDKTVTNLDLTTVNRKSDKTVTNLDLTTVNRKSDKTVTNLDLTTSELVRGPPRRYWIETELDIDEDPSSHR